MNTRATLTLVALGVASLSVAWDSSALGAPSQLKGNYGFTGEASCLTVSVPHESDAGFNSLFQPEIINTATGQRREVNVLSFSVLGIRTFNGDGTGSIRGTTVSTSFDPTMGLGGFVRSANSNEFEGQFTYEVDKDGFITTEIVPGSLVGKILNGPRAGQSLLVSGFALAGGASVDNKTLLLATAEPVIETVKFFNIDVDPNSPTAVPNSIQKRICHRSRVLIWLGP
jgi:hypothetical protein